MYTARIQTKVDTQVTLDNIPIDTVLKQICEDCHNALIDTSMCRDEVENNPSLNTAKTWRDEVESLEGVLCRILNYLGD